MFRGVPEDGRESLTSTFRKQEEKSKGKLPERMNKRKKQSRMRQTS